MTKSSPAKASSRLVLDAQTAAELMTPNPVSIRDVATVREAVSLLTNKGFSAAPVIDEAGRPVGVVSQGDILVHDRENTERTVPDYYSGSDLTTQSGKTVSGNLQFEKADKAQVRDIMTPVVFSVAPDAPAREVVENMVGWKVHRLFVVDDSGILVGVISALDILRHLRA